MEPLSMEVPVGLFRRPVSFNDEEFPTWYEFVLGNDKLEAFIKRSCSPYLSEERVVCDILHQLLFQFYHLRQNSSGRTALGMCCLRLAARLRWNFGLIIHSVQPCLVDTLLQLLMTVTGAISSDTGKATVWFVHPPQAKEDTAACIREEQWPTPGTWKLMTAAQVAVMMWDAVVLAYSVDHKHQAIKPINVSAAIAVPGLQCQVLPMKEQNELFLDVVMVEAEKRLQVLTKLNEFTALSQAEIPMAEGIFSMSHLTEVEQQMATLSTVLDGRAIPTTPWAHVQSALRPLLFVVQHRLSNAVTSSNAWFAQSSLLKEPSNAGKVQCFDFPSVRRWLEHVSALFAARVDVEMFLDDVEVIVKNKRNGLIELLVNNFEDKRKVNAELLFALERSVIDSDTKASIRALHALDIARNCTSRCKNSPNSYMSANDITGIKKLFGRYPYLAKAIDSSLINMSTFANRRASDDMDIASNESTVFLDVALLRVDDRKSVPLSRMNSRDLILLASEGHLVNVALQSRHIRSFAELLLVADQTLPVGWMDGVHRTALHVQISNVAASLQSHLAHLEQRRNSGQPIPPTLPLEINEATKACAEVAQAYVLLLKARVFEHVGNFVVARAYCWEAIRTLSRTDTKQVVALACQMALCNVKALVSLHHVGPKALTRHGVFIDGVKGQTTLERRRNSAYGMAKDTFKMFCKPQQRPDMSAELFHVCLSSLVAFGNFDALSETNTQSKFVFVCQLMASVTMMLERLSEKASKEPFQREPGKLVMPPHIEADMKALARPAMLLFNEIVAIHARTIKEDAGCGVGDVSRSLFAKLCRFSRETAPRPFTLVVLSVFSHLVGKLDDDDTVQKSVWQPILASPKLWPRHIKVDGRPADGLTLGRLTQAIKRFLASFCDVKSSGSVNVEATMPVADRMALIRVGADMSYATDDHISALCGYLELSKLVSQNFTNPEALLFKSATKDPIGTWIITNWCKNVWLRSDVSTRIHTCLLKTNYLFSAACMAIYSGVPLISGGSASEEQNTTLAPDYMVAVSTIKAAFGDAAEDAYTTRFRSPLPADTLLEVLPYLRDSAVLEVASAIAYERGLVDLFHEKLAHAFRFDMTLPAATRSQILIDGYVAFLKHLYLKFCT